MAAQAKFMVGETEYPGKRVICDNCDGTGTTVNPAIDGNGITQDEMAELGDDFLEDYKSGVYDVACAECHGQRVIVVPDEGALTPEQQKEILEHYEEQASYRAMVRMEMEAGC